jgi:hypothetical protein
VADVERTAGETLSQYGTYLDSIPVRLSRELITLLSEQLYQSPLKAVEELVVNSFDADATACRVFVPIASAGTPAGRIPAIMVHDNGSGMDFEGLVDLWRVGASNKRDEKIAAIRKRRQIGKFGIGKLATYALARRVTYVSCVGSEQILAVSLDFREFKSDPAGPDRPVELAVRSLSNDDLANLPNLASAVTQSGLKLGVDLVPGKTWTVALLEALKEQGQNIAVGRLRWVLRTAMPLTRDFKLYLNGEEVLSSKVDYPTLLDFQVRDLPKERLQNLQSKTGQVWRRGESGLVSEQFPNGICGRVIVTKPTLYEGKSADLTRSHGFFIRVRGRLIDEDNPLAGLTPRTYEVFNRFRAEIDVDDLDADLTAPREAVGISSRHTTLVDVLYEVFNEARARYEALQTKREEKETQKKEQDRNYVSARHVERPVADVLATSDEDPDDRGVDADEGWFYLHPPTDTDIGSFVAKLYETETREPYDYSLESLGASGRIVAFYPDRRAFVINEDHELVLAFKDDPRAFDLLKDYVTAEALLEVYLREANVLPHVIGEILERRDVLMRTLAREQVNSPAAIAAALRNAVSSERDLEVNLVIAARALGFVSKHLSGAENPDGVARFRDYAFGERKIILEAKSSADVPSLGAIDFGGLHQHMKDQEASGCLLVAPDYPGGKKADDAQAARRAASLKISCWTVEQLARIVESMDSRDITARDVLSIVESAFSPLAVADAVDALLLSPQYPRQELARAVLTGLRNLEPLIPDRIRSLDMLLGEVARQGIEVRTKEINEALAALVAASRGALTPLSNNRVRINTSIEELERRVSSWLGNLSSARRASTFRVQEMRPDVT